MTEDRSRRVEEIFLQALELPLSDRAAYLDEACSGQSALRKEVADLLVADRDAGDFLDDSPIRVLDNRVPGRDGAVEGTMVGPYRVLGDLGDGEISTVYLAERADDEYQQRVAIKIVRAGIDSRQILLRFRQERQILAALDHPYIARLLDGGRTDGGRPYFVMESVDGERIDDYCLRNELPIEDRLELFRGVCSAVHFAHQNLVVHRDLKPSNILVTAKGVPKLLDFGIAKLLDPALSVVRPEPTATVVRLLTPRYASPEQARGEPVTTASDVYSLGVVLYELLTGRRPYPMEGLGIAEIEQVICSSQPVLPSAAVRQRADTVPESDGDDATECLARVSGGRRRLARKLAGDLDTIAMTALRKDPERRYSSVLELEDDLRRHLERQPVLARPDSLSYRAGRFVRRNTVGVAAAAVIALSLIGGMALTTWQARVARVEQARAEDEQRRAEEQQLSAESVSQFLIELFQVSDPAESRGDTLTAREILDRGSERISEELAGQPEVQATLMQTIGRVYQSLGMYGRAEPLYESSLSVRRQSVGEVHPDVASSLNSLALLRSDQGEYEDAERIHRQVLSMYRELQGAESEKVATSINNLATMFVHKGDYATAERLHREALAMQRELIGSDHEEVGLTLNTLAITLQRQGDFDEAEACQREALEIFRALHGEQHLEVIMCLNNLAFLMDRMGRYAEAEQLHRETLALMRTMLRDDHPYLATTLNNLAISLQHQARYVEAEAYLRESLAMVRRTLGDQHPRIANSLSNLATGMDRQGRHTEAERLHREALQHLIDSYGEDHPHVAYGRYQLATCLRAQGDFDEAERLLRQAIDMQRRLLGPEHSDVASSLVSLARLHRDRGQLAEAERLLRESIDLYRRTLPEDHPYVATPLLILADLLVDRGAAATAEPMLREAVDIRRSASSDDDWRIADTESALGACLVSQGRYEEAEIILLASSATLDRKLGEDSMAAIRARGRVVDLYEAWDRKDLAADYREARVSAEATVSAR